MLPSCIAIVSGPSGVGKATVIRHLLKAEPALRLCISATDRAPRREDVPGKTYHFYTPEEFQGLVHHDAFVEHEEYADAHYGTLKSEIMVRTEREIPLIEVEVKGHMNLRKILETAETKIISFLVIPPSLDVLERRLRKARASELSEEQIRRRLDRANEEIASAKLFRTFGHVVINHEGKAEEAARMMLALLHSYRR